MPEAKDIEYIAEVDEFDYGYVRATARIACYDDLKSAPRITRVEPSPTARFIETLTTNIYNQAQQAGGSLPYTVIREVTENFIHAQFKDIVVSILDGGNTIRFADQGPGIEEKEKAQQPGFTSATEPMTEFIRGVGSGLPIVRDYIDSRHGTITIEDNLRAGAVVTISLEESTQTAKDPSNTPRDNDENERSIRPLAAFVPIQPLNDRERATLLLIDSRGALGVTDISQELDIPASTMHNTLSRLEQAGLVEKGPGKKRSLTDIGREAVARIAHL